MLEGDSLHLLRPRKINLITQLLWYLIIVRSLIYTRNCQDKKKEKNGEYTCRPQAETSLVREKKTRSEPEYSTQQRCGSECKIQITSFWIDFDNLTTHAYHSPFEKYQLDCRDARKPLNWFLCTTNCLLAVECFFLFAI